MTIITTNKTSFYTKARCHKILMRCKVREKGETKSPECLKVFPFPSNTFFRLAPSHPGPELPFSSKQLELSKNFIKVFN